MVIPSRWFSGGMGLDEFRESMLTDDRLRSIDDYLIASDVFPGVGLKGGVCYFLWDRDNPGPCRVTTRFKDEPVSTAIRPLLEAGADVFIRFNEGLSILKKVVAVESGQTESLRFPRGKRFDRTWSVRARPSGSTAPSRVRRRRVADDVLVYQNGGVGYMPQKFRSPRARASHRQVEGLRGLRCSGHREQGHLPAQGPQHAIPRRAGKHLVRDLPVHRPIRLEERGRERPVLPLLSADSPSDPSAQAVAQHHPQGLHLRANAGHGIEAWTDEELYAKYGITEDEIAFIESMVRPMELSARRADG